MWTNRVAQKMETDEKHDEDCVEEGFPLARVKIDRNDEGDREALVKRSFSINI